jgi:hypothetical protein
MIPRASRLAGGHKEGMLHQRHALFSRESFVGVGCLGEASLPGFVPGGPRRSTCKSVSFWSASPDSSGRNPDEALERAAERRLGLIAKAKGYLADGAGKRGHRDMNSPNLGGLPQEVRS